MNKIIQSGSLRFKYMAEELEIDRLDRHYSFYNQGWTYEQNVLVSYVGWVCMKDEFIFPY